MGQTQHIISASINLDMIDKSKIIAGKKGRYYNVDILIADEGNYGKNVSICEPQSKEQRLAKEKRVYIGNGKTIWKRST